MRLLVENAEAYLRSNRLISADDVVLVRPLSGGVSSTVIHASGAQSGDLVLKQALGRLAVEQPWYCSVERIWREIDVLNICRRLAAAPLPITPLRVEIPQILFEDRRHFIYVMASAPLNHSSWKRELMANAVRVEVAITCGALLARLHSGTWHDPDIFEKIGDRRYFDDLRVDPFYRQIARVHSELQPAIDRLVESVLAERHSLVHGDFSPKNILLYDNCLMLIDFEVGHYGDPAFDLGFFLSHLVLKGFRLGSNAEFYFDSTRAFWDTYSAEVGTRIPQGDFNSLMRRAILNFAGCALARLDGKSPVDYLADECCRQRIRRLCWTIFKDDVAVWGDVLHLAREIVDERAKSTPTHRFHNRATSADH